MGKTLVIKGADFSLNRLKKNVNVPLSSYKTSNYGYMTYAAATIGSPLSPTAASTSYDGYFVPINVSDLATNNYKVNSFQSLGSNLLYVAILDSNNNLLVKFPTTANNTVPEVIITEETLSEYEGTAFTLYICQNTQSGRYADVKLTKYEL